MSDSMGIFPAALSHFPATGKPYGPYNPDFVTDNPSAMGHTNIWKIHSGVDKWPGATQTQISAFGKHQKSMFELSNRNGRPDLPIEIADSVTLREEADPDTVQPPDVREDAVNALMFPISIWADGWLDGVQVEIKNGVAAVIDSSTNSQMRAVAIPDFSFTINSDVLLNNGDINGDGITDVVDFGRLVDHLLVESIEAPRSEHINSMQKIDKVADINNDGVVDTRDLAELAAMLLEGRR